MLLVPAISYAADISVGGVPLHIPSPLGFNAVTPQMTKLYELQKKFVPSTNEEFVGFIPDGLVPIALLGEIPDLSRRATVQVEKSMIDISLSSDDFAKFKAELKIAMKSQHDEVQKRVEKDLSGLMKRLNAGIVKQQDIELALSISQFVVLPAHEETEHTLAYSMVAKYTVNAAAQSTSSVVVGTTTIVHLKGKVLALQTYAETTGLEWSREASRQWASAVMRANPLNLQYPVKELPSSRRAWDRNTQNYLEWADRNAVAPKIPSNFIEDVFPIAAEINWNRLGIATVGGGIFGLLVVFIGWAIARVRRN